MTPDFLAFLNTLLTIGTFAVLVIGLLGLFMPVFPGLVIMWLATLIYALFKNSAGAMTNWDWVLFGVITLLMLAGSMVDNVIIARKMRDHYIPWSSMLLAFGASIVASIFFTPLIGLVAAPVALYFLELRRLRDQDEAIQSTKAYMVGWGWALGARVLIGLVMIGCWALWVLF